MPTYVRSASLTGYVDIVRAAGGDPLRMMREAGVSAASLRDPESHIDALRVCRLLEQSALACDLPDLGLRMARLRRLSTLGPVGLLVREAPTARRALETLLRHMRLVNASLVTRIEDAGELVVIREDLVLGRDVSARQAMELAVGALMQILRELLGPQWEPRRVCFAHDAPRSLVSHLRAFGRFVEFGADFNGIVCAARDLEARNPSADPAMARFAQAYVASMLAEPDLSTTEKVRRLVRSLLPTGRCSIEAVALELDCDRRTIHRHLAADGTTFSAVLRDVRAELVVRYLESSRRPLAEIADALGFASHAALARWFRAEFDCSITAWRRNRGRNRGQTTISTL
jgi:AraC-like DNA-binding protein